jgi:serine/threonine protein phosphatase PrpC
LGTDEDLRASKSHSTGRCFDWILGADNLHDFPFTDPAFSNDPSGCTAVACLLVAGPPNQPTSKEKVPRRIICANAGDSRSVLCVKGESKAMSHDHKPGNRGEFI